MENSHKITYRIEIKQDGTDSWMFYRNVSSVGEVEVYLSRNELSLGKTFRCIVINTSTYEWSTYQNKLVNQPVDTCEAHRIAIEVRDKKIKYYEDAFHFFGILVTADGTITFQPSKMKKIEAKLLDDHTSAKIDEMKAELDKLREIFSQEYGPKIEIEADEAP